MGFGEYSSEDPFIVLCNGSHSLKAGYANPFEPPTTILPSLVSCKVNSAGDKKYFALDSEIPAAADDQLVSPFHDGYIQNWEAAEELWGHALYKHLDYDRNRFIPILVTEPLQCSKDDRTTMVQTFFETFEAPALFIGEQSLMSLFGAGSQTGLVIDVGHEKTEIVPIFDSVVYKHCAHSSPLGAKVIEHHFVKSLKADKKFMEDLGSDSLTPGLLNHLKEVAFEAQKGPGAPVEPKNVTFGEKTLTVGPNRATCIETLFDPWSFGLNSLNVIDHARELMQNFDPEKRKQLLDNILLTGYSSAIPGLKDRFEFALRNGLLTSDELLGDGPSPIKMLEMPKYFLSV